MSRFDACLQLDLASNWADLALLGGFAITSALALGFVLVSPLDPSVQASVIALLPLWVALVMHSLTRVVDSDWTRLWGYPGGSWELQSRDGERQPATLLSNFQCQWVVLLSIRFQTGCHRQLIWRHRQPDSYRYLLVRLARQISNAQEA